jgi:hypothetical protein
MSEQIQVDKQFIRELIKKKNNWVYKFPFGIVENVQLELLKYFCELKSWENRKWAVVSILQLVEKIGICPSFVPKPEMLNLIKRYSRVLKDKHQLDIAKFHVYFGNQFLYDKYELIAKTNFQKKNYREIADEKGQTLLFHAIRWNNIFLVTHLLSIGFNLEHQDENGNTPLFSATGKIHKKNKDCINLLFYWGANFSVVNKNGKMPYQVAIHRGNLQPTIFSIQKKIRVIISRGIWNRLPKFIKKYKNIIVC